MRVPFAAIVVASVALLPRVGQANPITAESLPPSADAGTGIGHSSLFDESGDPIFLLSSINAFDPPGGHDKLRGGPRPGGIVFVPTGGLSFGSWNGFGGGPSGGGSTGGGSSPGFGSLTLISLLTQGAPGNPGSPPNGLGPDFGFGSANTFSFEPCCEDETQAVPEPSMMLMFGGGLLLGLERVVRSRSRSAI
jgi:PEP-CTERM motif-containing protein